VKEPTVNAWRSSAISAITLVMSAVAPAPDAAATTGNWGLNGTFIAVSNGDWAKTNEVYRDEMSQRSTWRITTQCSSRNDCAGQVTSDSGWNATIYLKSSEWLVERALPSWEPCSDGTSADGLQTFRFYPVDDKGMVMVEGATTWAGEDKTITASGSCGISLPLVITLPFKLTRVS
jgi:hypothetical protein